MRPHLTSWTVTFLLSLSGLGSMPAAWGDIMVFNLESNFLQVANIASTETFDEFPSNTVFGSGTTVIDRVTYTSVVPTSLWRVSAFSLFTPSPPNTLDNSASTEPLSLTFGNRGSTAAIGFFIVNLAVAPVPFYLITVTTNDGMQLVESVAVMFDQSVFRGFIALEGITSVSIVQDPGMFARFAYGLDNVSRGVVRQSSMVPEPSALVLSGIGAFALLAIVFGIGRSMSDAGRFPLLPNRFGWAAVRNSDQSPNDNTRIVVLSHGP